MITGKQRWFQAVSRLIFNFTPGIAQRRAARLVVAVSHKTYPSKSLDLGFKLRRNPILIFMGYTSVSQPRLERCSNPGCRSFILNSDVKCAHCGFERSSYKIACALWSVSRYVLVLTTCALV